jgi:hypothetical protein
MVLVVLLNRIVLEPLNVYRIDPETTFRTEETFLKAHCDGTVCRHLNCHIVSSRFLSSVVVLS